MKLHVIAMVLVALLVGFVAGQMELPRASAQTELTADQQAQVASFVNQRIRPVAELMRSYKMQRDDFDAAWQSVSGLIPQDSTIIVDGRAAEGIAPLTGQQIHDIAYAFNVTGGGINLGTVAPGCVRSVEVR